MAYTSGKPLSKLHKLKSLRLMNVAVSLADDYTLSKITKLLLSLAPDEMEALKEYLNDRKYLKSSHKITLEERSVQKIAQIAISSIPRNKDLKKIYDEFTRNANELENLKQEASDTKDIKEAQLLIKKIQEVNRQNEKLLLAIKKFRVKKQENLDE